MKEQGNDSIEKQDVLKEQIPVEQLKMEGTQILACLNSIAAALEIWSEKLSSEIIDEDLIELKVDMLKATGIIFDNI